MTARILRQTGRCWRPCGCWRILWIGWNTIPPDDFPTKIIFFADGETYEIICIPPDKEAMVEHALSQSGEEDGRRILIIEDGKQIARLHIPSAAAFCMVADTGEIQYFKQEQEEPY